MRMNGLSKVAATALFLVLAVVPAAVAVPYMVGDSQDWSGLRSLGYRKDLPSWGHSTYGPTDSVNEVDAAGYTSCGGTPINTYSGGDTIIELKTVGPKYYISPTPCQCQSGMRLSVKVVDASSGTPDALIVEE